MDHDVIIFTGPVGRVLSVVFCVWCIVNVFLDTSTGWRIADGIFAIFWMLAAIAPQ